MYVAFATLQIDHGRLVFSEGRANIAARALCRAALSAVPRGAVQG